MILAISSNSSAMTYGFDCVTNNDAANCSGTDSVFSLSVTQDDDHLDQVIFTIFHANIVGDTGEITEVYFDGSVANLGSYISSNPSWNQVVAPANLPGQNDATPAFVTDFSLDSDFTGQSPDFPILPGGALGIVFALLNMTDFDDVIEAIESGSLRLGLHVRSINLDRIDSSESFVSTVPVPAAVWLMGTGLIGLIGFGRKRQSM